MRYKRVEKFKKERHRRFLRLLLLTIVMPAALLLIGYLVASLIILPSMSG